MSYAADANVDATAAHTKGAAGRVSVRIFSGSTAVLAYICLGFFLKYCIYAVWITPLWEIPDESGHFSYVENLRQGDYPRIGEARMTEEVTQSWLGRKTHPPFNWISQHPPLYYALAAPTAGIAAHAGAGFEARVRSTRLVTALIGALGLLGLGLFVRQATGNDALGAASAVFIGATPMFTHLSSGVTHDPLVLATAAWSAYWCARWLGTGKARDAYLCAIFAALCTTTKITGIAMAVPLFAMMAFRAIFLERNQPIRNRAIFATALWLIMFLPICAWMLRNLVVFDALMPNATIMRTPNPKDVGFIELMLKHPIWQNVFLNFIALVGWAGRGHGSVSFIQATGLAATYFSGVILFVSVGSLSQLLPPLRRPKALIYALTAAALVSALIASQSITHDLATYCCLALLALAACSAASSLFPMLRGNPWDWLVFTSAAMTIVFALAYYHTIWSAYLEFGVVKALHGRYFYAILPFISYLLLKPFDGPLPSRLILMASVLSLCVSELFFLQHVFPMYGQV